MLVTRWEDLDQYIFYLFQQETDDIVEWFMRNKSRKPTFLHPLTTQFLLIHNMMDYSYIRLSNNDSL